MSDLKLEPYSELTPNGASTHAPKPMVTTVQITPVKASADIKDAIRRQKGTGGIGYSKGHPSLDGAKPLFRAVLSGSIKPNTVQCMITSPPMSNGKYNTITNSNSNHNANGSGHFSNGQIVSNGNNSNLHNKIANNGLQTNSSSTRSSNGVVTLSKSGSADTSRGGKSYSVFYDKQGKMTTISVQGNSSVVKSQGQSEAPSGGNSTKQATRTPRLTLTHRAKAHSISDYPDGFNRSLTVDALTSRPKGDNPHEQTNNLDDSGIRSPSLSMDSTDSDISTLKSLKDSLSITSSKGNGDTSSVTSSSRSSVKVSPRLTHRDLPAPQKLAGIPKSKSLDSQKDSTQRQHSSIQGLSCVQLADSILGAVSSDLNHVYQLCRSKLRYAEFIEKNEPHRLGDSHNWSSRVSGDLGKHYGPASSSSSTSEYPSSTTSVHNSSESHTLSPFSSLSPTSLSPLSSPKRVNLLPDLPVKSNQNPLGRQNFGSAATVVTVSSKNEGSRERIPPATPVSESEIDYDKPITIIIESDDDGSSARATRPILKCTSNKTEPICGNEDSWRLTGDSVYNDRNNNRNNNNTVPFYLGTASGKERNTEFSMTSTSTRGHNVNVELRGTTTNSYFISKVKGRLVRFSADHKIHEFAPFEPVTPKSDNM